MVRISEDQGVRRVLGELYVSESMFVDIECRKGEIGPKDLWDNAVILRMDSREVVKLILYSHRCCNIMKTKVLYMYSGTGKYLNTNYRKVL